MPKREIRFQICITFVFIIYTPRYKKTKLLLLCQKVKLNMQNKFFKAQESAIVAMLAKLTGRILTVSYLYTTN